VFIRILAPFLSLRWPLRYAKIIRWALWLGCFGDATPADQWRGVRVPEPFGSNLILLPYNVDTSSAAGAPKRKKLHLSMKLFLSDSEGFEPPNLLQLTVFKTAAFDHSASSPRQK